ncbi:MAG: hypothetical protein JO056_05335 [Alphaproteobacteria bacterium]|nr:hypothetical protein [Alphaproteobacteria bacterium]
MKAENPAAIKFGSRRIPLPSSRPVRIALGIGLLAGGCMFFLPILGLWMFPLGLLVLSADLPLARRLRRRLEVWWGRRKAGGK